MILVYSSSTKSLQMLTKNKTGLRPVSRTVQLGGRENRSFNGKCKIIVQNRNFMTEKDVKFCLSELKNKKCEGFDRIPVCAIYMLLAPVCFYILAFNILQWVVLPPGRSTSG